MRRLVYAPKAYVFVRSNTQGGRIYNLSPDVVSGSVTRNVNDLSTAEVVIRNRFRKWLKDPDNHMSILMPMDMITIWLQRINGKPIQVFTGYLDQVPYYQMYPGNCTITASCTLKRLQYSWFDPGLEWFQNWMNHIQGWQIINPETGEVRNLNAVQGTNDKNRMKITDGGFADLIQHFMIEIAGWAPENVLISDLPADLPRIAAQLYSRVQKENAVTQQAVEQLLGNIMGVSANPINSGNQDMKSHNQQNIVRAVKKVAGQKNVPLVVPITAALLTSGFRPAYAKHKDRATQEDDWGYGLYAMKPKVTVDHRTKGGNVAGAEGSTIEGVDKSKLTSASIATEVFLKKMLQVNIAKFGSQTHHHGGGGHSADTWLSLSNAGNTIAIKAWIEQALNRTFDDASFNGAYTQAQQVIKSFAHPNLARNEDITGTPTPTDLTWSSLTDGFVTTGLTSSPMDSVDYKTWAKSYHKAVDSLAPYYWMAKTHYSGIHLQNPGTSMTNTMVLGGNADDLKSFFDSVKNHNEYDTITLSQTQGNTTQLTTFKQGHESGHSRVPSGGQGATGSTVILQVAKDAQYPAWQFVPAATGGNTGGSGKAGGTGNSATTSQFGIENIGQIGFASAFLAHFSLSANWMESQFLTGYKALANDQPCLDGVKQFCQASMRSFMSLPNGQFCAFYPDYFGAHGRKPYWYIYDIEITNGGVNLSDAELATHVYTIGDTFGNDEQITEMDYVRSAGVVTLDMNILEGFIRPLNDQKPIDFGGTNQGQGAENLGKLKTAADFMYHYGARVYKEEVPMIRNQYFEFLYAWQRFMQKWAATFNTTIEFTFQPEVMCGGLIGFPQHNLQMYCENVTHQWDYAQGFSTSATLSSPAAMSATSKGDIGSLPGFAMAGNTNTVGAGAD